GPGSRENPGRAFRVVRTFRMPAEANIGTVVPKATGRPRGGRELDRPSRRLLACVVFGIDTQERVMAQVCEVCSKGTRFGHNVSHAHNVTNRSWRPNLQRVR